MLSKDDCRASSLIGVLITRTKYSKNFQLELRLEIFEPAQLLCGSFSSKKTCVCSPCFSCVLLLARTHSRWTGIAPKASESIIACDCYRFRGLTRWEHLPRAEDTTAMCAVHFLMGSRIPSGSRAAGELAKLFPFDEQRHVWLGNSHAVRISIRWSIFPRFPCFVSRNFNFLKNRRFWTMAHGPRQLHWPVEMLSESAYSEKLSSCHRSHETELFSSLEVWFIAEPVWDGPPSRKSLGLLSLRSFMCVYICLTIKKCSVLRIDTVGLVWASTLRFFETHDLFPTSLCSSSFAARAVACSRAHSLDHGAREKETESRM